MDSIVISALIGLVGVTIGVGGYAYQNWLVKKREMETKIFIQKRKRYEELIRKLSLGFHIAKTREEKTTLEFKRELDESINTLWLYGSEEVLRALNGYLTKGETEYFQKLILSMRKDLMKTSLEASEVEWFRST